MTIDYQKIRIILNKYLFGEICLNVETSATVPESIEDLASKGFSREGDPNDHELFEKYYSIVNKNQGINFKINTDRKSTRLNSSHTVISYAVFCLNKKKKLEDR